MRLDDPKSYLVEYSAAEKQAEEWRPVRGYEGLYEVSNLGRIKSLARVVSYTKYEYQTGRDIQVNRKVKESIIKPGIHKDFYWNLPLTKEGVSKIHLLHVLVADAFIPNPDNLPCVNHIDGDKRNIRISNLEWVTRSYNNIHAVRSGLRTQNIPVKCIQNGQEYASMADADRLLGLPEGTCWTSVHRAALVNEYTFIKIGE